MNDRALEQLYREHLEEDIIFCLSQRRGIPTEQAMRRYYSSRLADRIHEGEYGIQYLDYEVLTDILEEEWNTLNNRCDEMAVAESKKFQR